jgi:hypothetical protein
MVVLLAARSLRMNHTAAMKINETDERLDDILRRDRNCSDNAELDVQELEQQSADESTNESNAQIQPAAKTGPVPLDDHPGEETSQGSNDQPGNDVININFHDRAHIVSDANESGWLFPVLMRGDKQHDRTRGDGVF